LPASRLMPELFTVQVTLVPAVLSPTAGWTDCAGTESEMALEPKVAETFVRFRFAEE